MIEPKPVTSNLSCKGTKPPLSKFKKLKERENLDLVTIKAFYESEEWRRLRYSVLRASDGRCLLCKRGRRENVILHVDHIKPRSTHPELELELNNLQVLCEDCNIGKSNTDEIDWRSLEPAAFPTIRPFGFRCHTKYPKTYCQFCRRRISRSGKRKVPTDLLEKKICKACFRRKSFEVKVIVRKKRCTPPQKK